MNDHRDRKSTTLLHNHPLLEKEANQKTIEANDRTMPATSPLRLWMLQRQVPFPTISNAGDQPAYKGVRTRIMHTTSVNSKINQPLGLILTWVKPHQSVLNGPIRALHQNKVLRQSYHNDPIRAVLTHRTLRSWIHVHVIFAMPKGI